MLTNIQSLRAFAALNVAMFHAIGAGVAYGMKASLMAPLEGWGANGVDLFFVLSGFLMTLVLTTKYGFDRTGLKAYAFNRFMRIFPLYWLAAIMGLLTLAAARGSGAAGTGATGSPPWRRIISRHTSMARPSVRAARSSSANCTAAGADSRDCCSSVCSSVFASHPASPTVSASAPRTAPVEVRRIAPTVAAAVNYQHDKSVAWRFAVVAWCVPAPTRKQAERGTATFLRIAVAPWHR